jgi:Cu+-exporting ATPase
MTCEGCVSKVEKALLAVKGVASAKVDLEAKQAVVGISDDVKSDDLVKAIETAGFQAQIAAAEKSSEARG